MTGLRVPVQHPPSHFLLLFTPSTPIPRSNHSTSISIDNARKPTSVAHRMLAVEIGPKLTAHGQTSDLPLHLGSSSLGLDRAPPRPLEHSTSWSL